MDSETTSPGPTNARQPDPPTGRYVILYPPDDMTALERRVADVIRYDLHLRENSPPGIYLVAREGDEPRVVVKYNKRTGTESEESELMTAVESVVSVPSESTLANDPNDPSDVPFQVSKATKILAPTARMEHDPPQIRGSYVGLIYNDNNLDDVASHVKEKWALYTLQITINFQGHDVSFNVQADSGANSAWLFHRHACQLESIKDFVGAKDGVACKITLISGTERPDARPALPPSYMPNYVGKQIGRDIPSGDTVTISSHFHYPRVTYGSGQTQIVVGPMRSPIDFEIENAHKWLTSGPDKKENIKARFSFAICDAATTSIIRDMRIDGLIGFGPESLMPSLAAPFRHDQDYGRNRYPTFSAALQASLPNVTGVGGIVHYFYLNPPDVCEGFSFLAFNEFPEHLLQRRLSWTAPILIWKSPVTSPPLPRAWIITIKRLAIRLVADPDHKARGGFQDKTIRINFGRDGQNFFVDTGGSTTTLPTEAMLVIRNGFDDGRPYVVPEWVDLQRSTVEYTFGSGAQSNVVFRAPASRFICDKHRQGLIWDCEEPLEGSPAARGSEATSISCVLGLNFFHSVVVAMHRPQPGAGEPYFRFAPMVRRA